MKRFCFLTERQVGIGSAAGAIEAELSGRPGVVWKNVTYARPGGLVERLPFPGRSGGTLRGYLQVSEALRAGPFDALFFLTHNPAVFRQSELARTPTLLWTDVTPALLDAQAEQYGHSVDRSGALRALKHALVQRTFRRAALCVGWSEWARRSFVADYGVPEERTHVLAPGIDLGRFAPTAREHSAGALPRLLFVGGNFERKGGSLLLEVFRAHFRGKAELDLVTRDPVEAEPGVRVHRGLEATSPELLALFRDASAFVLPTLGDCFSMAGIEAMASGLPVIISDVGGIGDLVTSGENGFLVQPRDGQGLRAAIAELVEGPSRASELGRAGRKRAEARHDAKRVASSFLELLTALPARVS